MIDFYLERHHITIYVRFQKQPQHQNNAIHSLCTHLKYSVCHAADLVVHAFNLPFLINTLWIINSRDAIEICICCNCARLFILIFYNYVFCEFDVWPINTHHHAWFIFHLLHWVNPIYCTMVQNMVSCVSSVGFTALKVQRVLQYGFDLRHFRGVCACIFSLDISQFLVWFMLMLCRFLIAALFSVRSYRM